MSPSGSRQVTDAFELPNYPIQCRGTALRPPDIMIRPSRIPEHVERPAFRAMRDEAAQREPDFDCVDLAVARTRRRRAKDVERQVDDDPLMARHRSVEVTRLHPHDILRVHTIVMRRPVAVAGAGLPAGITAIG